MLHGEEVPGTAQSSQSGRNGSFVHSLSFGVFTAPQQGREEGQLLAAPGMRSQRRNPEPSYHQHFTPSEHTLQGREQPAMATRLEAPGHPFSGPQPSASDYSSRLVGLRTPLGSLKGYGDLIMLHRVLEKPAIAERVYIENKWQHGENKSLLEIKMSTIWKGLFSRSWELTGWCRQPLPGDAQQTGQPHTAPSHLKFWKGQSVALAPVDLLVFSTLAFHNTKAIKSLK